MRYSSCVIFLAIVGVGRGFTVPSSIQNTGLKSRSLNVLTRLGNGGSIAKRKRAILRNSPSVSLDTSSSGGGGDGDEIKATKSKLTKDFFSIALPAFIQLAAEPLASLVDTAYLGRMGPEVLGGAGVAISAQYAVSKLYNDPLLRTSISLIASEGGKSRSNTDDASTEEKAKNDLSIAASSALLLALSVGVIQLIIYASLASGIIKGMG